MIFAVFDPSPLTLCINCSFFTFICFQQRQGKQAANTNYSRRFLTLAQINLVPVVSSRTGLIRVWRKKQPLLKITFVEYYSSCFQHVAQLVICRSIRAPLYLSTDFMYCIVLYCIIVLHRLLYLPQLFPQTTCPQQIHSRSFVSHG